jgi:hypothetical protein
MRELEALCVDRIEERVIHLPLGKQAENCSQTGSW